jgi:hypothetical protein
MLPEPFRKDGADYLIIQREVDYLGRRHPVHVAPSLAKDHRTFPLIPNNYELWSVPKWLTMTLIKNLRDETAPTDRLFLQLQSVRKCLATKPSA